MKLVSMSEREPEAGGLYLTLDNNSIYRVLFWDQYQCGGAWPESYDIRYWCSLPPKPNKVEMAIEKITKAHCELCKFYHQSPTLAWLENALSLLKEHLNEMSQM